MPPTSEAVKARLLAYYGDTTRKSYLASWAVGSFGFHFGLADDRTRSHAESVAATNAFLAERAGVGAGSRVLDAGCGVGGSTLWLAEAHDARVVGVTLVPEQQTIASELAAARGLADRVAFHCMDMLGTPFPEGSFDVVWSIESVCHVEDLEAYLRHAFFLLADGGRLACIDIFRGEPADEALERVACDGWVMARPLRTLAATAEAARAAGFIDVVVEDLTPRAEPSIGALDAMVHNTRPLLRLEAASGFENGIHRAHVEAAGAVVQGMRSGSIRLGHLLAVRPNRS